MVVYARGVFRWARELEVSGDQFRRFGVDFLTRMLRVVRVDANNNDRMQHVLMIISGLTSHDNVPFFLRAISILRRRVIMGQACLHGVEAAIFVLRGFLRVNVIRRYFRVSKEEVFFRGLVRPFIFNDISLYSRLSI